MPTSNTINSIATKTIKICFRVYMHKYKSVDLVDDDIAIVNSHHQTIIPILQTVML